MGILEAFYVGCGCSPYHPKMMIKLWIYGYCERYYTSRRLAKAIRENIHYMWLSGHHQPCFKTLNNFRSEKLSEMIDIVFKEVLEMLVELGYINLDDLYVDGSKWEANGNRHKVVWRKNTERYKGIVIKRIEELLQEIKALQDQEESQYGASDLAEMGTGKELTVVINSEFVKTHLAAIDKKVLEQFPDAHVIKAIEAKQS